MDGGEDAAGDQAEREAVAPVAPKITRARVRSGPVKAVAMIDRAAGAVNAAEIPVINRDVISNAGLVATAPSPEATVKTVRDARNSDAARTCRPLGRRAGGTRHSPACRR